MSFRVLDEWTNQDLHLQEICVVIVRLFVGGFGCVCVCVRVCASCIRVLALEEWMNEVLNQQEICRIENDSVCVLMYFYVRCVRACVYACACGCVRVRMWLSVRVRACVNIWVSVH